MKSRPNLVNDNASRPIPVFGSGVAIRIPNGEFTPSEDMILLTNVDVTYTIRMIDTNGADIGTKAITRPADIDFALRKGKIYNFSEVVEAEVM